MLIGFADTETTSKYSTSVQKGLRDVGNTTTVIYSIHKDRGGNNNGDDAAYAEGYGVTRKLIDLPKAPRLPKVPLVTGQSLLGSTENDDQDAFTFYADNGTADTPPTRTVAKVDGKNIYRHLGDFLDAKAIDKNNRQDHGTMPLVWAWYALPRFYK
jgi:hypothetical protein